ncbi:MAG: hypothetical protein JXA18_15450, partial [Chitinispirillaceae bacterium]|nr:hypothetical protein [Chitinispirillaceae bacterium]
GSGNMGSDPNQAWGIAKAMGIPDVKTYGGFGLGKFNQWVSGYPIYYNAMTNRIDTNFVINTSTAAGITKMKQWLFDHQKGDAHGGCLVMCYNASGERIATIGNGLPEAGKKIMYQFGSDGGHAVTVAGYNDSVRYDYNNDGRYTNSSATDVTTWEIGAYLMVNSWGTQFGSSGKVWIPYRMLALGRTGIWQSVLYGMKTRDELAVKPLLTYKIVMSHNQRRNIRLRAGYANSATATAPTGTPMRFSNAFNYSGGNYSMQGINSNPIEIGLDVSSFMEKLTSSEVSLFLVIDSKGGTGNVASFSVLDYSGGETPVEIACSQTNVNIPTGTTTLKVTRTLQPLMALTPNGGEMLERGRAYTITWFSRQNGNVKIELLKGNTVASTIASSAPSGGYEWAIPADLTLGSDYKVKIISIDDASVSDASDDVFSIKEKSVLELTSPLGGEFLEKGKAFSVTWNTNVAGDLVIDLYKDRMPVTAIMSGVNATGPYSWTPPDSISSGNTYSIRLSSKSNPLVVYDESKNFFTIINSILNAPITENFDAWNAKDSIKLLDSWEESRDDELDWWIHKGPTPSKVTTAAGGKGTGPNGDHTTGNGNYLYLESSIPNNPSKLAVLLSPMINTKGRGNLTIDFWYHMYSRDGHMGDLYVDVFTDSVWNDSVAHFTGDNGDMWHQKTIRLADIPQIPQKVNLLQVRFMGTTGTDYDGDICLDDFSVTGDVVSAHQFPPSTSVWPGIRIIGNIIKYNNVNGHLSVITLNGAKILDVPVKGEGIVDMSKLSRGVYCVKVNNEIFKILR